MKIRLLTLAGILSLFVFGVCLSEAIAAEKRSMPSRQSPPARPAPAPAKPQAQPQQQKSKPQAQPQQQKSTPQARPQGGGGPSIQSRQSAPQGGGGGGGSVPTLPQPLSKPPKQAPKPPQIFSFSLAKSGDGKGTVRGNGVSCGYKCSSGTANYIKGASLSLSAEPQAGSKFDGWGGSCGGKGSCNLNINSNKNATAKFSAIKYDFTVKVINSGGSGSVSGNNEFGKCKSSSCAKTYNSGRVIILIASPDSGSKFFGWSGACSGSGECKVTMDKAKDVSATFTKAEKVTYSLSVSTGGGGSGYIKSTNESGIECGISDGSSVSSCSSNYESGERITLAAVPEEGSKFSSWSGDTCSGSNQECVVHINKSKSIKANFEKK